MRTHLLIALVLALAAFAACGTDKPSDVQPPDLEAVTATTTTNPCQGKKDGTACSTGNPCKTGETCRYYQCQGGTLKKAGSTCSTGDLCKTGQTCNSYGTCGGGTTKTCTASDQCHAAGTCNSATGACSNPTKPDGTTCNDGIACTTGDACQGGVCRGTGSSTPDDGNPCTADSCDATGAHHTPLPAGTSCSDGNACNGAETCDGTGVCRAGTSVACMASDQCHDAGTCNPATGACSNPAKADGATCSDGNACTAGESCRAGTCVGGAPVAIDDGNPCTADACDPTGGVMHVPTPVGSPCSDGNACNGAETCDGAGLCRPGTTVICIASDQCHDVGTCDPASGACSNPAKPNGSTCSDGNACTAGESCQAGACVGGGAVAVDDHNPCTSDGCDPASGVQHLPVAAGTSCTDGNACNGAETCDGAGECKPGTAVTCAASDQCHDVGTCDPATGNCSNPAKANGAPCDDGDACTTSDACQSGTCAGNAVTCTAQDACHDAGTCSQTTGQCSNPLKPVGSACGTGTICTASGQCVPSNLAPVVDAGPDQTIDLQQPKPTGNFTFQKVATQFNNPIGIEYHPILNKMVMSVNYSNGQPHNFEAINADGTHAPYTTVKGLTDEVYFAIARDDGGGHNLGGFVTGEMYVGTGVPGAIAKISPDGSTITNPWVTLPGETGLLRGMLQFDRTGVFGGDLLVTTTVGHLWRVTVGGTPTQLAAFTGASDWEGLAVVPNDPTRYGPWAGKILVGDENVDAIWAVDVTGAVTVFHIGVRPEDIMVVPPGENLYGVDFGGATVWGASASQFNNIVGDVIIAEEFTGDLWDVFWNGSRFDKTLLGQVRQWEHTAFGPAPMAPVTDAHVQVALPGTATDDGQPAGSTLSVTWSVVSGPAPVTFANSHAAATTASFIQPGTYVLALTGSDGTLSTSDQVTITIERLSPNNTAPTVDAGPDQTVTLPNVVDLQGVASDDGVPIGSAISLSWSEVSGPAPVSFVNSAAGLTSAFFTQAGTYVLKLEASDGELTGSDTVTINVNAEPSLSGGSLQLTLGNPGPLALGTMESVTALLLDASATPIPGFPVQLTVTGANPVSVPTVTDSGGAAQFLYTGTVAGTDDIHATALGSSSSLDSATVSVAWTDLPVGAPLLTQGWIGSPLHQSTITDRVPVVLSNQITLTSGTVRYWPATHPDQPHTIASGLSGGPGATLATFDPTVLPNGSYILELDGTNDAGDQRQSEILVTLGGDYKPGRVVVEVTDLTVPVQGIPITIGRRYDSLEKDNVGDFGHGWSLMIGHPRLEVDPANDVTMTMPNGRRVTFQFTPTFPVVGPVILGFFLLPAYTPESGVYGTLTSDGCGLLSFDPFGGFAPICFDSLFDPAHLAYAPTTYTYTDPYGTVYVLGATGELRSIEDRYHNKLTFTANGIASNTGMTVPFIRDAAGRITDIRTPPVDLGNFQNIFGYAYDTNGDLQKVTLPINATHQYTYDTTHRLLTTRDPRGNPTRTSTYDASGRLASDKDALNNVTSYAYDLVAHTATVMNPDGGRIVRAFDASGLLVSETDPLNHTTQHAYDDNRNEILRTNARGEVTRFTYDIFGNQATVSQTISGVVRTITTTYNEFSEPLLRTDAAGNIRTSEYDEKGLPTTFRDALGTLAKFTSSDHGLPLSFTDAAGKSITFSYDQFGNLLWRRDRLNRKTQTTYDFIGRPITITDPRGGVTTYRWDPLNRLVAYVDPLQLLIGSNHVKGYDVNNNLTSEAVDFLPQSLRYGYDALDHLTQLIYGDNQHVDYTRDFRGNPLMMKDELGRVTTYAYDLAGQMTKTTYPNPNPSAPAPTTTRAYDEIGRLASVTDERGHTTTYEYETGCGCPERLTKITDPLGRVTRMSYDAVGRKVATTDAAQHTTSYSYDVRGHLVDTTYPDGTKVHNTYDAIGRRSSTTDQTNATTTYGYDDEGQLTSVTDPLNNVTRYAYDAAGNLISVTDAGNHTTVYEYDILNRRTKRTLPLGMLETFAYDPYGQVTSHVDFKGKTTTQTWDNRGRLVTRTPDASLGEPTESYVYNANGTRASMTDASGTTSYTYDVRNRLLTKAAPAGTLTYSYDPTGNVASVRSSNANGTSVDYAWDAANLLASVTDNRVGGVTTTAFTATGRLAGIANPNGVSATYSYDSLDRVASLVWNQGANPAFSSSDYTYNGRGQRLTSTQLNGRQASYAYDASTRLISEAVTGDPRGDAANGTLTYALDGVGNRLSRTAGLGLPAQAFSYDANDRIGGDTFDLNGNTTASNGDTFAYDFRNRLKGKNNGAVTLVYDCDGNRVAKTAGGVTTRYLVDDLNPTHYLQVLEEVSGGVVQVRYTFGTSLVSQTRLAGTPSTSFYGFDSHGNTTFLTDMNGSVTDSYDYDAWGILVGKTGSTPNTRLYAGEELDPDLGLISLRARHYSASTGRFLTLDPLDLETRGSSQNGKQATAVAGVPSQLQSALGMAVPDRLVLDDRGLRPLNLNHFLYAGADPVNRIDPTGREEADEYIHVLALVANMLSGAIHLLELEMKMLGEHESESQAQRTRGAMYCAGAIDAVDPFLLGSFNPWVGVGLATLNLFCTFAALLANGLED